MKQTNSNLCDPIRSKEEIKAFYEELKNSSPVFGQRNYMLAKIMCNTGMRISDALDTKVGDWKRWLIDDGNIEFIPDKQDYRHYDPEKNKIVGRYKVVRLRMNPGLQYEVANFIKNRSDDEWMFRAQGKDKNQSITRYNAWKIIKDAAERAGVSGNIGNHSCRKTFGYTIYNQAADKKEALVYLQKILQHSDALTTMRYIGIMQEDINNITYNIDI